MDKETTVVKRRGSIEALQSVVSEQDFKQKMGMYISFIMEFYRVLMGSFLIVFVPQKCGDSICGLTDNIITTNNLKTAGFVFNAATFVIFLHMYYAELKRENKLITYLDVNPELPRDNDAVGEALVKLPDRKRTDILRLDKYYQMSGRCAMFFYFTNVAISTVGIFNAYLDDKTITVLLTNVLFMTLKLYDTKTITDTEENVFLSAYLTRKIQYNDVDPDKMLIDNDVGSSVDVETGEVMERLEESSEMITNNE